MTTRRSTAALVPALFLLVVVLAAASTGAAQPRDKDELLKDWYDAAALAKEFEPIRYEDDFKKDPAGFIAKFKVFWEKFPRFWQHIEIRSYERDSRGRMPDFDAISKPLDLDDSFASYYNRLLSARGHDKTVAQWCTSRAEESYRNWKRGKETPPHPHKVELHLDYALRALEAFKAAKELAGTSEHDDAIRIAQEAVAEQTKLFEANLHHDEMKFPPHNHDWQGEGVPAALAAAALEHLLKSPDRWGDSSIRGGFRFQHDLGLPIAASLHSKDWRANKKNALGAPTQWEIQFIVAFGSKSRSRFAYRFIYSFYTKDELGVAKAPPFSFCNPHQYAHCRILAQSVPGAGGAGTVTGTGRLWQLALFLSCIVAGLLAAAPLINTKVPALKTIYGTLTPLRTVLGVVALAVGVLDFLRVTLLHFSPLANILPQVAVVVTGLFLGKELLMKKPATERPTSEAPVSTEAPEVEAPPASEPLPAGIEDLNPPPPGAEQVEAALDAAGEAAEKAGVAAKAAATAAQDLLIRHKERIESLEKFQVPMGLASLVLGFLHLMAGGYPLF